MKDETDNVKHASEAAKPLCGSCWSSPGVRLVEARIKGRMTRSWRCAQCLANAKKRKARKDYK